MEKKPVEGNSETISIDECEQPENERTHEDW